VPKATRLEQATRVETVRQLILSGNEHGRIVQQVAEKWAISERMGWRYLSKAQAAILAVTTPSREYLLAEHMAVRIDIRRRAREAHDLRAELAAAQDEAKLFGLYPDANVRLLTWQDKVIELLVKGQVTPQDVTEEFGDDLATDLFRRAGLPAGTSRPARIEESAAPVDPA
jgi:hypothetical protein